MVPLPSCDASTATAEQTDWCAHHPRGLRGVEDAGWGGRWRWRWPAVPSSSLATGSHRDPQRQERTAQGGCGAFARGDSRKYATERPDTRTRHRRKTGTASERDEEEGRGEGQISANRDPRGASGVRGEAGHDYHVMSTCVSLAALRQTEGPIVGQTQSERVRAEGRRPRTLVGQRLRDRPQALPPVASLRTLSNRSNARRTSAGVGIPHPSLTALSSHTNPGFKRAVTPVARGDCPLPSPVPYGHSVSPIEWNEFPR